MIQSLIRPWHPLLLAAGFLAGTAPATAQPRVVILNGELLDAQGLAIVDALNCGYPVDNGNYWADFDHRVWGYVGLPGAAPFPDCAAQPQAPAEPESDCERQYPVHEDRMCYCYHVC